MARIFSSKLYKHFQYSVFMYNKPTVNSKDKAFSNKKLHFEEPACYLGNGHF